MNSSVKTAQWITYFGGAFYLFVALALLFAPRWFFDTIGNFPPFNRHYEGDLGTFLLPQAIAMFIAARDLHRHRLVIWIAVGGGLFHTLNHSYDAIIDNAPLSHWMVDVVPLALFGVLAAAALWLSRGAANRAPDGNG